MFGRPQVQNSVREQATLNEVFHNISQYLHMNARIVPQFHILHSMHYNSNQRMLTIVLKSQYYNTPAATYFGPHWPINREHTIVQNSYIIFSACSGQKLLTEEPRTQAAPTIVFSTQLDIRYILRRFWQLHAVNDKHLFCVTVCSLMLDCRSPQRVAARVL
jgi:hypothetical protein